MKKWIPPLLLALAITGCAGNSDPNAATDSGPGSSSAESPTAGAQSPSASPSPSGSPSVSPSPTEAPAVLNVSGLSPLFGFANKEGTKLLSLPVSSDEGGAVAAEADKYRLAVGEGGQTLALRFEKHQSGTEQNNGRQAAHNFDNLEGDLYEVVQGKAVPDASYYLVEEEKFEANSLIPVRRSEEQAITPEQSAAVSEAKGRGGDRGWHLATLEDGRNLYAVQFERLDNQMLASLAVEEGSDWTFMDYPAEYDENSTWRVDDGGEIAPGMFSFLFAARSAEGLVLGVKWMGAEGENLSIVKQNGDRFEETEVVAGRYLSPI